MAYFVVRIDTWLIKT